MDKPKPTKPEADVCEVFYVRIEGVPHQDGFPYLPNDQGLVREFLEWQIATKVFPMHTMTTGGGRFVGLFWMKDVDAVHGWLQDHKDRLDTFESVPEGEGDDD